MIIERTRGGHAVAYVIAVPGALAATATDVAGGSGGQYLGQDGTIGAHGI